jgi:transposase
MGGTRVVKVDLDALRKLVDEQPDATIAELHQRQGKDCCSESAVGMALLRLGLSFKKKTIHAAEQDRPDVVEKRAA